MLDRKALSTRDYTPDELRRGRFLRHFMGFEDQREDPTVETEAVPAEAAPRTRESVRPTRYTASSQGAEQRC